VGGARSGGLVQDLGDRGEKLLANNLSSGEKVLVKLKGNFGQAFVLSNRRLYVVKWGFQAGQTFGGKCVAFELPTVTGVQIKKHLASALVEVLTPATQDNRKLSYWGGRGKSNNAVEADNAVTFPKAASASFQEAVNLIRSRIAHSHSGTHPGQPAGYGNIDIPEQIRKLGELRDSGILTAEEFETKKAELLGLVVAI
jgi:Short C-terminal domain